MISNIKYKLPKHAFEQVIRNNFKGTLTCSPYDEICGLDEKDNPKVTHLTLYYENDKHVATWCKGKGWFVKVN